MSSIAYRCLTVLITTEKAFGAAQAEARLSSLTIGSGCMWNLDMATGIGIGIGIGIGMQVFWTVRKVRASTIAWLLIGCGSVSS